MSVKVRDGLEKIRTIKYSHSSTTTKDVIYFLNGLVMLAVNTALANAVNIFVIAGLIEYAKVSAQAWTAGALIYWDDTNSNFTTVAAGNTLVGIAAQDAANPTSTGYVILMPELTAGVRKQTVAIPLSALTANTSVYVGCLAAGRAIKVTRISIAVYTKPADADGDCTLKVENYDASASAADNLLSAATFDLEGITTAKVAQDLTLTSTTADLILAAADYIYATLINNSAAIDTNMAGGVLVIEFEVL